MSLTNVKIQKMRDHFRMYGRTSKHQITFNRPCKCSAHFYAETGEFMFAMFAPNYVALDELITEYQKLAKLNNPTEYGI